MKIKLYVTTMYRANAIENHSYVLGVWSNYSTASFEGQKEKYRRNGKFSPQVTSCYLNACTSITDDQESDKHFSWRQ